VSSIVPPPVARWAATVCEVVATEQIHQHCAVFIAVPGLDGLVLAGQLWGAGDDSGAVLVGEWVVPLHGSVCGRVYREGRPALVADTSGDPEYRTYPGALARSELAVPIVAEGETVGVLNLESPRPATFRIVDLERSLDHARRAGEAFAAANLGALLGALLGSDDRTT